MSEENCYVCGKQMPEGQSFYEDHQSKVCLNCYRTVTRCRKCGFPSKNLKRIEGFGEVCEFCYPSFKEDDGMTCYLCQETIWSGASHYADHGKHVCQNCFKNASTRCFTCRFPKIEKRVSGVGGICEFCLEETLTRESDVEPLLEPIVPFLRKHGHDVGSDRPRLFWTDWRLVLGMQMDQPSDLRVTFFDELVRYCYPVYYMNNMYYVIPAVPRKWFLPYMAGQFVAADLCKTYQLTSLRGESPFLELARGWCHWIAHRTALVLKYDAVSKTIGRWPESSLSGSFPKFQAMSEFRKPPEIIEFARQTLADYAKRYL